MCHGTREDGDIYWRKQKKRSGKATTWDGDRTAPGKNDNKIYGRVGKAKRKSRGEKDLEKRKRKRKGRMEKKEVRIGKKNTTFRIERGEKGERKKKNKYSDRGSKRMEGKGNSKLN